MDEPTRVRPTDVETTHRLTDHVELACCDESTGHQRWQRSCVAWLIVCDWQLLLWSLFVCCCIKQHLHYFIRLPMDNWWLVATTLLSTISDPVFLTVICVLWSLLTLFFLESLITISQCKLIMIFCFIVWWPRFSNTIYHLDRYRDLNPLAFWQLIRWLCYKVCVVFTCAVFAILCFQLSCDSQDLRLLSSRQWGSLFTDNNERTNHENDGRSYMNTLWGYIIRKYSDIAIPHLECIAGKNSVSFSFVFSAKLTCKHRLEM